MASWPRAAVTEPEPLMMPVTVPRACGECVGVREEGVRVWQKEVVHMRGSMCEGERKKVKSVGVTYLFLFLLFLIYYSFCSNSFSLWRFNYYPVLTLLFPLMDGSSAKSAATALVIILLGPPTRHPMKARRRRRIVTGISFIYSANTQRRGQRTAAE